MGRIREPFWKSISGASRPTWLDIVGLQLRVNKDVKETIGMLSSVCYPNVEIFKRGTPQCIMDKFLKGDNLFSEFVQKALEELAFSKMHARLVFFY